MKVKDFFKSMFSRVVVLNCLGMILLSVVLGFGLFYTLDVYTNHGEEIEVPDLYGQNIEVAKKKLESLGLDYLIIGKAYREKLPERSVVIQSIAHGEKVKEGRVVELYINSLNPTLEIPDGIIGNSTLMEARAILTNIGFKLAPIEYVKGEAKDWVVQLKASGKSLRAGSKLSAKTPLVIVVSDGSFSEIFAGEDSFFEDFSDEEEVEGMKKNESTRNIEDYDEEDGDLISDDEVDDALETTTDETEGM